MSASYDSTLVKTTSHMQTYLSQQTKHHLHSEPLHLPATQRRPTARRHPARAAHTRVVDIPPEQRSRALWNPGEVVAHRALEVRVEGLREATHELCRAAELGRTSHAVVVSEVGGVAECDVVAYLQEMLGVGLRSAERED